ncbi:stealth conserved region 3 domain-containing protein [Nocardioides sp. 1609]|uniref:stealth conserved region 3 domain-containing protein n=1 Tax=Nocardioides sp. 1609 TaxID=2508327 RepID=UPI0010701007|nr:stealth conserved region 3 domain-containing protein [Nocardioides sp. 1609]
MRIGYLVFNVDGMGGTSRSAITQANALAADHDVRILSVTRTEEQSHYAIDRRVAVDRLVDVRDPARPAYDGLPERAAAALHARESALVPARWDAQFTALCDVALEAALPDLDVDVLVTVTPGLLVAGLELAPGRTVVVHQEHRSSSARTGGLEPLLAHAPRADVVSLLTPGLEAWLHDQLGGLAPTTVVVPNPLPLGFTPRSTLDSRLITTAGRLVGEKQFGRLVEAFALVADDLPGWRLRLCGEGPQRVELLRQVRKWNLWDRVELPGTVTDMAAEWAKASVVALSSKAEGYPLVLQEAMAAGVPAVSFDCPSGPREIIDHDVNGLLVAPQSVNGLASALRRIAGDDDLRRRLGRGALETARQWDAAAVAERWVGIFSAARAARGGQGRLTARAHAPAPPAVVDPTAGLDVGGLTPAKARHAALAWAVDAARSATDAWLVVPAHERPAPTVVVPMTARTAVLEALARPGWPAYLCLRDPAAHGWPERRGVVDVLAGDLRSGMTSSVWLEPWPEVDGRSTVLTTGPSTGCGVEIQFWESAPDGGLVSPRRGPYADWLPDRPETVDAEVDGVAVRTLPLMLAPTATEATFPVDVVYTWVDGNDAAWDDARRARLAGLTGTAQTREASGRARFVDRGELRYSMRSLHLFAPWVRRIHLVTAGQVPPWLDVDHPAVHLVDHRDLLPAEALPTFNSHAIESVLHRIDGLAEHFVYLNDDMLFGRPVRPETFFSPAGLTSVFLSTLAVGLTDAPGAAPFAKAAWNNRALLQEAFGAVATHHLAHAPYAHRVSVLGELAARFPDALAATTRSPFRSDTDVSTLSSLAQHYGLLTGTAYVGDLEAHPLTFVNLSNSGVDRLLRQALDRQQDFLCLGDHHDHALGADSLDRALAAFFERYYPVRAPWEREDL